MLGLQIYQANPLDLDLGGEVLASESLTSNFPVPIVNVFLIHPVTVV